MQHNPSIIAIVVFALFVAVTLGLSFYFGRKARSAQAYFAAGGGIHWVVNGVAFAGDYLSAASFLGICGMIAFYGYDGFLYSIGFLAGWIVALLVVAEPLKRLGKYTFADALDSQFQSRGIRLAAAISTLAVSIFYLIPQMVGAGALIQPLLGFPHWLGVVIVGSVVTLIVVTAGMVSTTYVQFIKGSLLVLFSGVLVALILQRGLTADADPELLTPQEVTILPNKQKLINGIKQGEMVAVSKLPQPATPGQSPESSSEAPRDVSTSATDQPKVAGDMRVAGDLRVAHDLRPVGHIARLPNEQTSTGPLSPLDYLRTLQDSDVVVWRKKSETKGDNQSRVVTYAPEVVAGEKLLRPGNHPIFKGINSGRLVDRLDFISLMLALFGGTASLPHILIRYYTVKDETAARKSTVVGIGVIGCFYVLTLFLGLGAMTSGVLDVTDENMSAPLLAKSYGNVLFAVISAIAFTTVLGTVSGLIVAASGAVVHDLLPVFMSQPLSDHDKVRVGKLAAVAIGVLGMALGMLFQGLNVGYLVGWAFSVAASANLPALVMLLFWKRTTRQGITAAILVGMVTSLGWILVSGDTFEKVYKISRAGAWVPFSQPGIVTIPLGFIVLIVVSLMTRREQRTAAGA
ncbi:MAG: cation acetate symporter [Planctomycetota bacterium]